MVFMIAEEITMESAPNGSEALDVVKTSEDVILVELGDCA